MIALQTRDREILRLCYDQQFVLVEHVAKFFRNESYRECCRRIQELKEAEFIREERAPVLGRKIVYRLTHQGLRLAQEYRPETVSQSKVLSPATLVHDALVTSVRLRLHEIWSDAQFIPERAIKGKEFLQIPDGLLLLPSGNAIALEVENSDKGRSRFQKILTRWKEVPRVILVLYVATTPTLFATLKRYLEGAACDQPVGLLSWEELRTGRPQVWTTKGELPLLERSSF